MFIVQEKHEKEWTDCSQHSNYNRARSKAWNINFYQKKEVRIITKNEFVLEKFNVGKRKI